MSLLATPRHREPNLSTLTDYSFPSLKAPSPNAFPMDQSSIAPFVNCHGSAYSTEDSVYPPYSLDEPHQHIYHLGGRPMDQEVQEIPEDKVLEASRSIFIELRSKRNAGDLINATSSHFATLSTEGKKMSATEVQKEVRKVSTWSHAAADWITNAQDQMLLSGRAIELAFQQLRQQQAVIFALQEELAGVRNEVQAFKSNSAKRALEDEAVPSKKRKVERNAAAEVSTVGKPIRSERVSVLTKVFKQQQLQWSFHCLIGKAWHTSGETPRSKSKAMKVEETMGIIPVKDPWPTWVPGGKETIVVAVIDGVEEKAEKWRPKWGDPTHEE